MNPLDAIEVMPVAPEILVAVTGMAVLLIGAIAKKVDQRILLGLTLAGLAAGLVVSVSLWGWDGAPAVLGGMIAVDKLAVFGRIVLLVIAGIGALYGYDYFKRGGQDRSEYYALLLFATAGMTLLTASADLIMVFIALEVLSLSLYVLVGFTLRLRAGEASLKYFLLGAFSSAFFLYGVAMAYGSTGTTNIVKIANVLTGNSDPSSLVFVAAGLLAVGFFFKVAAVPFHMWTPDAYQGAATSATAFMAAGTKVAAFIALIRVFDVAFQPLTWTWVPIVIGVAAVTLIVGAVLVTAQSDVKRMLAYSAVLNAGFILVGLTSADARGIGSALFYLVAYAAMTAGAFGILMIVSHRGDERTSLDAFRGLAYRSPGLSGLMAIFLISLAGIPPTAGFVAKIAVFGAATTAGHWPLALLAVLASVVAAYAYLRVVVQMYMREPEGAGSATQPKAGPAAAVALAIPLVVVVGLGIFPGAVANLIEQASVLLW